MIDEDREFHERRVEQEAKLALEANSPQAARAHTQLAALHSEQVKPKPHRDAH
jgi:hypothetical protein